MSDDPAKFAVAARVETSESEFDEHTRLLLAERLYREHHRFVYRLALRYGLGDRSWAEDRTQEVFISLLDHLHKLDDIESIRSWLYRVTSNSCLMQLRRQRLRNMLPLPRSLGDRRDSPETAAALREELGQVAQLLDGLPPKQRVVLCMHHLDGKRQTEIAELLGYSRGYVSKLLDRAHIRIREQGWSIDG